MESDNVKQNQILKFAVTVSYCSLQDKIEVM